MLFVQTSGEANAKGGIYATATSDEERNDWVNTIRQVCNKIPHHRDRSSIREGYIYKASSNGKRWSKRYIRVSQGMLSYYRTKEDIKPAGEIVLPGGFVVSRVIASKASANTSILDDTNVGVLEDSKIMSYAASYFNIEEGYLNVFYVASSSDSDVRKLW
uniref:Rho GTPase-activating protein 25 n=1 Tax=Lygus hesperus TaxID=30085 RepID=A0A0A9Y9E5_LYGHE